MRRSVRVRGCAAALALGAMALGGFETRAEEERKLGWADEAELGYVFTSGNSESSSFGFKNKATHRWTASEFVFKIGGIRVDTTTFTRYAVGTGIDDAVVTEIEDTETTAEAYYANVRYQKDISPKFFWYGGAGWERNQFAGFDNRTIAEGGVGNLWRDDGKVKFRTDYAVTLTKQEDVIELPEADDTWVGVRGAWDYSHKFGESTVYGNILVVDLNAEETDDWRADMINSVTVSMSKKVALKASLRWLYDHQPAFEGIPLYDADPGAGGVVIGTVPRELDELDTIFTTSLVVTF